LKEGFLAILHKQMRCKTSIQKIVKESQAQFDVF